ncbi:MAG: 3-isopropylmalate dehydrogenase [Thermoanaerobaculia bacterium]
MNPVHPKDRRPQRIAVLPGDGIGQDVTAEAVKVLETVASRFSLPLELEPFGWGADHYLATGETLPPGAYDDFRDNFSAILMGAFGDPRVPSNQHAADILLGTRFKLDLYINLRPVTLYHPTVCPLKDKDETNVDMVIFRENTEGAYVGVGGVFKQGTPDEIAVQEEINTRKGVERILRAAFEFARSRKRRKVTMADKANVMQHGHGLWRRTFAEVARDYPEIATESLFVDALAMLMVKTPEHFDVVVTNNLFGDILTDLGAALAGGLGVAASANLHPGQTSMFEPVHGSAPNLVGTGKANPMGSILSAALMLEYLGHEEAAQAIEAAVREEIRAGRTTEDLGGNLTTLEVGSRLVRTLRG